VALKDDDFGDEIYFVS